jgi:hypothetical protein
MNWSGIRRRPGPTSHWYQRETRDGRYVARRVVSQYGLPTKFLALKRDARGNLSIVLGERFRSLASAMAACEQDAHASGALLPA